MKMVAYGIGMVGLIASAVIYLHVAAKYLFVRILRNSKQLHSNSAVHWETWLYVPVHSPCFARLVC